MKRKIQRSFPNTFKPELAYPVDKIPSGNEWLHEIKLDGYRILAFINQKKVKLISRNGKDWTIRFSSIQSELKELPLKNAILDGEVVIRDEKGISRFQLLQNLDNQQKIEYFVFDIPYLNGYDLSKVPLIKRKEILAKLLENRLSIFYLDHIEGHGEEILDEACRFGLEGIVSKQKQSSYHQNKRTRDWCKTKCINKHEFVIGGFTAPKGGRSYFGALLLGYYKPSSKKLAYCGRVGTGFSDKLLKSLYDKFKETSPLPPFKGGKEVCPFQDNLEQLGTNNRREVTWLKPKWVAEIAFSEWTDDNILRQPVFLGIREDKSGSKEKKEIKKIKIVKEKKMQKRKSKETKILSGIKMTHPDEKIEIIQITKAELAKYYETISDKLLPHIIHRPLSVVRCPRESKTGCFYQKHLDKGFPKEVDSIIIKEKEKNEKYLMIKNLKGLLGLVQMNGIEIHPWGSRDDDVEKPDRITFDLDPDPNLPWKKVIDAAFLIKDILDVLKLKSYVKTSGGKGLHIVLPILRTLTWDELKSFCEKFAKTIAKEYPTDFTATVSKSKREGKIFLDYLRNVRGATSVAPYIVRARACAPISTPVSWSELNKLKSSQEYTIANIYKRLGALKKDPWEDFFDCRQVISKSFFR